MAYKIKREKGGELKGLKKLPRFQTGGGIKYPATVKSSADTAAYREGSGAPNPSGGYAGITLNKNYAAGQKAAAAAAAAKAAKAGTKAGPKKIVKRKP